MDTDLLRIGAAYIRVSDERQDEYSPDSQLKKIREHAAEDGLSKTDEDSPELCFAFCAAVITWVWAAL